MSFTSAHAKKKQSRERAGTKEAFVVVLLVCWARVTSGKDANSVVFSFCVFGSLFLIRFGFVLFCFCFCLFRFAFSIYFSFHLIARREQKQRSKDYIVCFCIGCLFLCFSFVCILLFVCIIIPCPVFFYY